VRSGFGLASRLAAAVVGLGGAMAVIGLRQGRGTLVALGTVIAAVALAAAVTLTRNDRRRGRW